MVAHETFDLLLQVADSRFAHACRIARPDPRLNLDPERLRPPALRYYLLDISQPLLAEAYRHASAALDPWDGITPIAILGNFYDLPQYVQLSYCGAITTRRKLLLLLGGTFGNLEDERRFLRDSLCAFPPGTLLLIDFPLCFADPAKPDEVRARDPWLAPLADAVPWREPVYQFWTGPLRRYVPGCTEVSLQISLSAGACLVPGSYTIEAMARVLVQSGCEHRFSVFRLKRYEPIALVHALRGWGWDPVDGWPYGQEVGYPRAP